MAEFEEVINLKTKTTGTESVKSLRQEIKEAQADAIKAARSFGEISPEATKAAQKVAKLRDEMGDFQQRVAALNPDRFQAIATVTQGIAGGISAATGAMALFGAESEDVQKTLVKVQGAIAFSQGIQSILDLKKSFGGLATIAASIATILVASWGKISKLIDGVSDEQEHLNELSSANLETQEKKLDAIENQDNVLRLQGKTELEILKIKEAQSAKAIKAAEINLQNSIDTKAAQVAAAKRNQEILIGIIKFITAPIQLILNTVDRIAKALGKDINLQGKLNETISKLVFDPEETAKEGDKVIEESRKKLDELKNLNAGYALQIKEIYRKSAEDRIKQEEEVQSKLNEIRDQNLKDALQIIGETETELADRQLSARDREIAELQRKYDEQKQVLINAGQRTAQLADLFNQQVLDIHMKYDAIEVAENKKKEEEITAKKKEEAEKQKKIAEDLAKAEAEAKKFAFDSASQLFGNLSQLAAQGAAEQKALAITQVLIDEAKAISATIAGATSAAAAGGPAAPFLLAGYITSGLATVAASFKRVKDILKTSAISTTQQTNAPAQFNPISSSFLSGSDEVAGQMKDMRVYVLEGDITKTQGRQQRNRNVAVI